MFDRIVCQRADKRTGIFVWNFDWKCCKCSAIAKVNKNDVSKIKTIINYNQLGVYNLRNFNLIFVKCFWLHIKTLPTTLYWHF